jgi:hypothetical protein
MTTSPMCTSISIYSLLLLLLVNCIACVQQQQQQVYLSIEDFHPLSLLSKREDLTMDNRINEDWINTGAMSFMNYGDNNITILSSEKVCFTNPGIRVNGKSHISSRFLQVFNGCHLDTSNNAILLELSLIFNQWFTPTTIIYIIFVFVMVLPWLLSVYENEQKTTENMSRFAYYMLHSCSLIFRTAWTAAFGTWLLAVFRQPSPCVCALNIYSQTNGLISVERQLIGRTESEIIGYSFGMPSVQILVTTLLALHTIERMSIFIGLLAFLLIPCTAVFSGISSAGQVLTGFAIAIPLHFYQTRTPQWLRIVDFIFNIIAGFVVLPLVKHFYLKTDFEFASIYLEGLIMQIFAFIIAKLFFSFSFLKVAMRSSIYDNSPLDIQHMKMRLVPEQEDLHEGEQVGYDHTDFLETSRLTSRIYSDSDSHVFSVLYSYRFLLYAISLGTFLVIVALKVATAKYIDKLLSFGKV